MCIELTQKSEVAMDLVENSKARLTVDHQFDNLVGDLNPFIHPP